MPRTPEQTDAWLRQASLDAVDFGVGFCLKGNRIAWDVPAKYGTAWLSGQHALPLEPTAPPFGSVGYWSGGGSGAGHVVFCRGGGMCWTTDFYRDGMFDEAALSDINHDWGQGVDGLQWRGWSRIINDVVVLGQDHEQGGGDPIPPEDLDMTLDELDAYLRDPARSALRGAGPQMRVTQILGKPEQYAWNGFRFEHIYSQDRKNGLMATGALAAMPIDTATEAQFDQAVQHTREHGTFEPCGCSSPTCRLKAA